MALLPVLFHTLSVFFSLPIVAAGTGILLGVGMLFVSRASFRLVTPEHPEGLAIAGVLLIARMVAAALALFAYHRLAHPGFNAFAATFAAGFFVMYWIELVRYAGLLKTRPRTVSRQG